MRNIQKKNWWLWTKGHFFFYQTWQFVYFYLEGHISCEKSNKFLKLVPPVVNCTNWLLVGWIEKSLFWGYFMRKELCVYTQKTDLEKKEVTWKNEKAYRYGDLLVYFMSIFIFFFFTNRSEIGNFFWSKDKQDLSDMHNIVFIW